MYRTASNAEDLDILDELHSFDSVSHATDRTGFWALEDKYKDVDFYLYMLDDDSDEPEIKQLLNEFGYKAYLEYSDRIVKIG